MKMKTNLNTEDINSLIEAQLDAWPEARDNFFRLRDAERRPVALGALDAAFQHNPARIRSTGARVDAKSISERPCFLCRANRPEQQITGEWLDGWEFLVNPYPILPVHFTVAAANHRPQAEVPVEMAAMAEAAPDLVFFYNGARAGASAPDHMHAQAVLKSELPLLRVAEKFHSLSKTGFMSSEEFGVSLPFHFISAVVTPDAQGMKTLAKAMHAFGIDRESGEPDSGLVNAFFWISEGGLLRYVIVPRRAHRPECYFKPEGERLMVSPGAIDMAGIVVLPRKEDFERIDEDAIRAIYSEVAFADGLPEQIKRYYGLI